MKRTAKILGWTFTAVLVLTIVLFGLIYFLPDYNIFLVRSESMKPSINMGDMIITGPVNGEIKPGTVITYGLRNDRVTHRVDSISDGRLVTKGDAVEDVDPWLVDVSDVQGVYLFKVPYVGYATNFIRTKLGWFLAIIVPATVLVGWLVKDIVKEAFSEA
jgi:signal peptidase